MVGVVTPVNSKNVKNGTIKITILYALCTIIANNLANVSRCFAAHPFTYFLPYILSLSLSLSLSLFHSLLRFYEASTMFSAIFYFEIVLSNLSCYSFSWMSIWLEYMTTTYNDIANYCLLNAKHAYKLKW